MKAGSTNTKDRDMLPLDTGYRYRRVYDDQYAWIEAEFGVDAANSADYDWGCGECDMTTKVYGHGMLISWIGQPKGKGTRYIISHDFQPF
jgi:hypothetical protein